MGTFQPIGADLFSLGPALAVWGAADEQMFAFAVGMDQALWYAQLDGDYFAGDPLPVWSAWRSLGGVVTSSPCAVRRQPQDSSVDVFALGIASELLHWSCRDSSWVDHPQEIETAALSSGLARGAGGALNGVGGLSRQYWESLGGVLTSPAHAVRLNQGVFAFARGTDQALWSRSFVSGSWSDWISLGRILASSHRSLVVLDPANSGRAPGDVRALARTWLVRRPEPDTI